jgi:hypothetical protein
MSLLIRDDRPEAVGNEANLVRQRCKTREPTESRAVEEVRNLADGGRCAARGGGMSQREHFV